MFQTPIHLVFTEAKCNLSSSVGVSNTHTVKYYFQMQWLWLGETLSSDTTAGVACSGMEVGNWFLTPSQPFWLYQGETQLI